VEPYLFNQMIVMYSRMANKEGVERIVRDMDRLKIKRNANTYVALVSYYALRAPVDSSEEEEVMDENPEAMAASSETKS